MSKKIHVRPGKSQSKFGFIVGLLFCLLGLFVAIPIFGPFGIIWTGMAALITFINYRNGFTDKQIDSHVIDIEESRKDVESRLRKLQSLYDQALITREEYEQKKKDILEDL